MLKARRAMYMLMWIKTRDSNFFKPENLITNFSITADVQRYAPLAESERWGCQIVDGFSCGLKFLIISDRRDWRDTQSKCLLARNPDRRWWHRHTGLKLFCRQPPWLHGQQGLKFLRSILNYSRKFRRPLTPTYLSNELKPCSLYEKQIYYH